MHQTTTVMNQSTTSHLITSQPTTKLLTTLLLSQDTTQSQFTNQSHQCTTRMKTHMLNITMNQ